MKYTMQQQTRRRWPRRLLVLAVVFICLIVGGTILVRHSYNNNLKPVAATPQGSKLISIEQGATADEIGQKLEKAGLIRSAWAFKLYVSSKEVRNALQAGEYELDASQSVPEIVAQLTHGKIATNLVTLLPGQRIDQIRKRLVQEGFKETDVDRALNPDTYKGHPALVDKPKGASFEGYLYPDSYQKTSATTPEQIITQSLDQMHAQLTPDRRNAYAAQGLSTYQAIILASVVEREVPSTKEREQAAQVFLKRLREGIRLESDATASYGAVLDGVEYTPGYNSRYNTYRNGGLPPTPISNVTGSSLEAVAHPADTDWLYFVSGDDGITRFSKTLEEHEANVTQYCRKNCGLD